MPTYEYACDVCEHHFSEYQRMADDPLQHCPECDGQVHRIISGGLGLVLKGRGSGSGCDGCGKAGSCSGGGCGGGACSCRG